MIRKRLLPKGLEAAPPIKNKRLARLIMEDVSIASGGTSTVSNGKPLLKRYPSDIAPDVFDLIQQAVPGIPVARIKGSKAAVDAILYWRNSYLSKEMLTATLRRLFPEYAPVTRKRLVRK